MNRRALLLAPLGIAAVGGAGFWAMLTRMQSGTFDPRGVPSALIGKPVPDFALPAQAPGQGFTSADVATAGRPILINFFASWCVPCIVEHPTLMKLKADGLPIWGIAYKDKPEAAAKFIADRGNPFARIAADEPGEVAINFGVYGVPETYLIDKNGHIQWRWAGALTEDIATTQLRPKLASL